jgi:hypothetical protein
MTDAQKRRQSARRAEDDQIKFVRIELFEEDAARLMRNAKANIGPALALRDENAREVGKPMLCETPTRTSFGASVNCSFRRPRTASRSPMSREPSPSRNLPASVIRTLRVVRFKKRDAEARFDALHLAA